MFNINDMMSKMKDVQEKMKLAQENLKNITATGEAGAGMVKVEINGDRKVTSIEIDPSIITKEDQEMIQDLTVAAVNKALENIEVKIKEEMQNSAEGMMPNIPGFDLSKMM